LQVCYAAGYLAEVLRHSPYGAQVRLVDLAETASRAADQTDDSDVADLAGVIRRAADWPGTEMGSVPDPGTGPGLAPAGTAPSRTGKN
jgi:hypothetical protein